MISSKGMLTSCVNDKIPAVGRADSQIPHNHDIVREGQSPRIRMLLFVALAALAWGTENFWALIINTFTPMFLNWDLICNQSYSGDSDALLTSSFFNHISIEQMSHIASLRCLPVPHMSVQKKGRVQLLWSSPDLTDLLSIKVSFCKNPCTE